MRSGVEGPLYRDDTHPAVLGVRFMTTPKGRLPVRRYNTGSRSSATGTHAEITQTSDVRDQVGSTTGGEGNRGAQQAKREAEEGQSAIGVRKRAPPGSSRKTGKLAAVFAFQRALPNRATNHLNCHHERSEGSATSPAPRNSRSLAPNRALVMTIPVVRSSAG